ncbi:Hemolymph juvenile hormone binding protein [Operophtera brumata]|uniref:Hemolymph juvenile hormone binding protein n=1 Tax=Operophtera brumata TaxID=104452 RepID=A0A0L7LEZ6_OPEBR|nr:Hemolymph juvenile hormone binding protein [Operophtera brumata]
MYGNSSNKFSQNLAFGEIDTQSGNSAPLRFMPESHDASSLLKPCLMNDIECLSKSTEQFLENTSGGIPQYDIRAIDPLIIPSLEYLVDKDMGLKISFKNLNVTGLRNTKKVVLQTKADLHIIGDLTIELTKDAKKFSGTYDAISGVLGTARYNYDLKTDDKGVEHFEVGPETIECVCTNDPTVS